MRPQTRAAAVLVAVSAILLVGAIAAIVVSRSSAAPVAASPTASTSSVTPGPTAECGLPTSLDLARHQTSTTFISSLSAVELTDQRTNQMRWTLGFLSTRDAPGPASVSTRVEIMGGGVLLQVLGYELVVPEQRTLRDGDLVTVAPCKAAMIVVRTAGPLLEGTWAYTVAIEKIGIPEGRTVPERLDATLTCSNKTFSCTRVPAGASQPPTATSNAAVLRPRFGVIYSGVRQGWDPGSAQQIRREGAFTSVGELAGSFFNQFHGAVAPDGRRAVYPAQPANGAWTLYLLDGAKPNEQRALLALRDEIPGQPVWSSDGSAFVFTAQDSGATQGVTPKYDSIRTYELATGKVREIARSTDGSYYQVLGWDRRSDTIAAVVIPHAQPASTYIVIGPSGTKTSALDRGWGMYGSPDAQTVVGIRCAGSPGECSFWTWPLADFAARKDEHFPAGLSLGIFGWRAGANDVGLSVSDLGTFADAHLELWSPSTGRRTVFRFTGGLSLPSQPFFRADGSAIILPGYGEGVVVDLSTGATSPLPFPEPTGPYERALPEASIRLDAP